MPGVASSPPQEIDTRELTEMVEVPGGSFLMGSTPEDVGYFLSLCRTIKSRAERDAQCREDLYGAESPQRWIALDGFFIDRTEVKVGDYRACVEASACTAPSPPGESDCSIDATWALSGDLPVNCVTWHQADTYCRWLGKRLPTAAEWEKAARGTEGARFPWGQHEPGCQETGMSMAEQPCEDSQVAPENVELRAAGVSPSGALRMADNVEEWTADWYHSVAEAGASNPQGPERGARKLIKGGKFLPQLHTMGAAFRGALEPDAVSDFTGFRCAVSASQVAPEDPSTH